VGITNLAISVRSGEIFDSPPIDEDVYADVDEISEGSRQWKEMKEEGGVGRLPRGARGREFLWRDLYSNSRVISLI
jgi:hypothetical protein